jgi:hypothetical protein
MVCDVGVPVTDVDASNNRVCATCPAVTMDEVRLLLLGHHSSDGTAAVCHLPVATKAYCSSAQMQRACPSYLDYLSHQQISTNLS